MPINFAPIVPVDTTKSRILNGNTVHVMANHSGGDCKRYAQEKDKTGKVIKETYFYKDGSFTTGVFVPKEHKLMLTEGCYHNKNEYFKMLKK